MNHQTYPWISFAILAGIGSVALFLAMPRPFKWTTLLISVVVLGVVIGTSLLLSKGIGLKVFLLNDNSISSNSLRPAQALGLAALAGFALGSSVLVAIRFLFIPILPQLQQRFTVETNAAVWKRVIISFDSAIIEELVFRLFLFSLLIFIAGKIWNIQKPPNQGILWTVNLLIAITFGAAHLPQWSTMTSLTPLVILIVIFLNSIGGLIFGYLYFSKGLEAAMVAHFFADIVLHVIGPVYLQS